MKIENTKELKIQKWRLPLSYLQNKWGEVFKSGPSKIYGRQSLKKLKGYGLIKQTMSLEIF